MRNFLLWTIVIIISIGIYYSINQEQSTTDSYNERTDSYNERTDSYNERTDSYNERKEDAASHRNYNEPRVQVSASELYSRYNSNSIRAKALYDGKLIEITDSPLKVDIAPDGDGIIYLADFFLQDFGVYAKGGEDFKSEAAKLESIYDEITLLCYSDEFSTENNILTDCIFDLKTNSERKTRQEQKREQKRELARQKIARQEQARQEQEQELAKQARIATQELARQEQEIARQEEAKIARQEEAKIARQEQARQEQELARQERIKAYAAITKSESKSQNDVETEPYNTTYVDGNSSADSDYFD